MLYLSLIIPTYNESKNIPILLERLDSCLKGVEKEIIVVDDNSPDGTWELARALRKKYPWLRVIRRIDESGLSSAVLKGFENAEGEVLAVMDADLQHDEQALLAFLEAFYQGADMVVGSRHVDGGEIANWNWPRKFASWTATTMAKLILPFPISDPMSGFFAIRKEIYQKNKQNINPRGFKILLEFLARARGYRIKEVGYTFKDRIYGESKLSGAVIYQYLQALYDLSLGKVVPVRFVQYGIVGAIGLFVATLVIWLCSIFTLLHEPQIIAISIEINILTNFLLNNYWTFRNAKLRGFGHILRGFVTFNAICLGGALINQALAVQMLHFGLNIYLANTIGYVIAAIWNYVINVTITWKNS